MKSFWYFPSRFSFRYLKEVCSNAFTTTSGQSIYLLSNLSALHLDSEGRWYEIYGGVIDVDITHESEYVRKLMLNHRVAIVKSQSKGNLT